MQLWWQLIIPLQKKSTLLNWNSQLWGESFDFREGHQQMRWVTPVMSFLLLSCESCCLHNMECLLREQRAASFELPLVLILLKLFVCFASSSVAKKLLFHNLNSPIRGDRGQSGNKRLDVGDPRLCALIQTVCSVTCIRLPDSVPSSKIHFIFPYLTGKGNFKGCICGTQTWKRY